MSKSYQQLIRIVPDFPKKGILFRDITPLLGDRAAFQKVVLDIADPFRSEHVNTVVAIEARGYIFGAPVAYELGVGFVPVRKQGKLPWHTMSVEHSLEYGSSTLEMHRDGLQVGQRALIVDDVLATGGTLEAAIRLVEQVGAQVVGLVVLAELTGLQGRERFKGYKLTSLLQL